jgi:urease subunit beta
MPDQNDEQMDTQQQPPEPMKPGEIRYGEGEITLNPGKKQKLLWVVNKGDRPVQVGSHYHFAEVNSHLCFDRKEAWGRRLNVPAGKAERFEARPNEARQVSLVEISRAGTGERYIPGLRVEYPGAIDKDPPELPPVYSVPGTYGGKGDPPSTAQESIAEDKYGIPTDELPEDQSSSGVG